MPEPFRIDIPESELVELRRRLQSARSSDDFANSDFSYGVERSWLESMIGCWADGYNWRAHEAAMNAFPQFKCLIDGVPIHFIHVSGKGPNPVPVVLTHGWPWTFWDWKDTIGPLTDPAAHGTDTTLSFDVVVPSLPGFGFSSPLRVPGIGLRATARIWNRLMSEVLGYGRYVAAGGDWGGIVSCELGHAFPDRVRGVHSTLLSLPRGTSQWDLDSYADDEAWMIQRKEEAIPLVTSHLAVHRNDPQTLAYTLADSPVGMAAWIWERRRAWSDPVSYSDQDAEREFLCTTASIYWFTRTIGTSMRFYKESVVDRLRPLPEETLIPVPTAFGFGPQDVAMMPRKVAAAATNLQQWTKFPTGGHFVPHEIPSEWVDDLRRFVGSLDGPPAGPPER